MSTDPRSPDDTLQKLLARNKQVSAAYNVSDALTVDELSNVRRSALNSQAIASSRSAKKLVDDRRGRNYWFNAR